MTNLWTDPEHAFRYLAIADSIPHRIEGERVVLELLELTPAPARVLDLGTGDGRLGALILAAYPDAEVVACDFAPHMLERARERFATNSAVSVVQHDLNDSLPQWEPFDAVVSSFAIHHVDDSRKQSLFHEIAALLRPGRPFLNLEHVQSRTPEGHVQWMKVMNIDPLHDDPSNRLAPVPDQLTWLDAAGFRDADCFWKWRELALLAAWKA